MINQLYKLVLNVNKAVLEIYDSNNFDIVSKLDSSPVTKADLLSHKLLTSGLKEIMDVPVMSEEDIAPYEKRKSWDLFWLIDPLDGTKDFIAKNGEFTINIALIKDNLPILGIVSIPFFNEIYYAQKNYGAFKNGKKIFNFSKRKQLIGADSNFYSTIEMQNFFKKYNIQNIKKIGSSIKLCKLAEGEIDVYPRLNETKEWDTAAAHIIANEAGCKLIDIKTNKELVYNKRDYRNNYFIASRNDLEFNV